MIVSELSTKIDNFVDSQLAELIDIRRHLHANPEVSWHEQQTTQYLRQFLASKGFDCQLGPCERGLIVDLAIDQPNEDCPIVAVRGDIDAIPIEEQTGVDYASRNPGIMHGCGHDVHATILLGTMITLRHLAEAKSIPQARIRGLLQPAEEVGQGADEMIKAGWLDGVEAIFGYHVDPSREVGRVGVKIGIQTAYCDEVVIRVNGQGGHSARPHETNDAVYAASQLVNSLYSRLPRKVDSRHPVVLSICQIHGGSIINIIPQQVQMSGTLRALNVDSRIQAQETIREVVFGISKATGTNIELEIHERVPGVINDPDLMELVTENAVRMLGSGFVDAIPASVGGEDFAFYTQKVAGAFTRIGCGSEEVGYWDLHSPNFNVDERAIGIGIRLMTRSVLSWISSNTQSPSSIT